MVAEPAKGFEIGAINQGLRGARASQNAKTDSTPVGGRPQHIKWVYLLAEFECLAVEWALA